MSPPYPLITTARLTLRLAAAADAAEIVRYYRDNQAHLAPWEPRRTDAFYTTAFWQRQAAQSRNEFLDDRAVRLFLFENAAPTRVAGAIGLGNIVRGAGQFGTLGYSLGAAWQGRGLMTEALGAVILYAFSDLRLHRLQANYLPRNERSARVLRRLGFVVEGVARDYLRIDGRWEDHVLTGLTNPDWAPDAEGA